MDIYYTSDIHSYLTEKDGRGGGYLALARHYAPGSLVLDGGDVIQGSPLAMRSMQNGSKTPAAAAFRAAGVTHFCPGNHDFNFGPGVLRSFIEATGAKCVCANLEGEAFPDVVPYDIVDCPDGTRIGISGVVTDYVNIWDAKNIVGFSINDSALSAKKALEALKSANCDFTVLIYHGGYEISRTFPHLSDSIENRAHELMAQGWDLVLTGHQHVLHKPFSDNGCLTLQNAASAMSYARISLEKGRRPKAEVLSWDEGPTFEKPEIDRLVKEMEPVYADLESFMDEVVGTTVSAIEDSDKLRSMVEGCSMADFFNLLQLDLTGADVSVTSLFNEPTTLGPVVTVGDCLRAYPFANTVQMIEMTGAQIKTAMERSAEFLDKTPGGKLKVADRVLTPKVQYYDYNFWANLRYRCDISRPIGERVVELSYDGVDLLKETGFKLKVALNSYRACGTGGYPVFTECPVLMTWQEDIQELIFRHFRAHSPVKAEKTSDYLSF